MVLQGLGFNQGPQVAAKNDSVGLLYPAKLLCKYTAKLVTFAYNVTLSPILSQVKYRFDILQFNKISRSIDVVVKFEDVSDNGC